jgi:hypothetical protein
MRYTDITCDNDEDNVIAALEHSDRVCELKVLSAMGSQLGKITTVMQEPFPGLRHLEIITQDRNPPVLPAKFLGGSAPRLHYMFLSGIPFPALPTLLLSTHDLTVLILRNIPPTGYISPEAMVVGLAALPRLESLRIEFQLATLRRRPPPVTRTVLPTLISFHFRGASEYLEDLVSRIDAPQLGYITIRYLNQLVDFRVAQLSRFIDRSVGPKLTAFRDAYITFYNGWVSFCMHRHADRRWQPVGTDILCEGIDWQVSHMAQVLSQFSATLSVHHLDLNAFPKGLQLKDTDDVEWQLLLRQFSDARTLCLSQELAGHVALALEDIAGETVAEVLPFLDLIYLEGQPASSVEKFVAARQLSDRPVAVIDTETEFKKGVEFYVREQ